MIETMLPAEERRVLELSRKLSHLKAMIGDIEGSNRGHLNLPPRIANAYREAYRNARDEFDDTRQQLRKAIRIAEQVSPGCSSALIADARL